MGAPGDPEAKLIHAFYRDGRALHAATGVLERQRLRPAGAALPRAGQRRSAPRATGRWARTTRVSLQQLHLPLSHPSPRSDGPARAVQRSRANAPLDELAKLCGFPGKLGMDGAQVWPAFQQGRIGEIRAYCETDVANTWLMYCRFQLLRGAWDAERHAAEIALTARDARRARRRALAGVPAGLARCRVTRSGCSRSSRSTSRPTASRDATERWCSCTTRFPASGCARARCRVKPQVRRRTHDRGAAREQPQIAAALPALRRVRRLLDAAPRRTRAARDQAAFARGPALAPRQGARANRPAPDGRSGLGLPLPGAPVGAPRAEEGWCAGRVSRARLELRGRHARVSRAARVRVARCSFRCAS